MQNKHEIFITFISFFVGGIVSFWMTNLYRNLYSKCPWCKKGMKYIPSQQEIEKQKWRDGTLDV